MRFLVLVLTSSALYNLWPQHASHLQTDVNLLDAVHHTRAPHLKCLWGKCVLWGRAEIMWGWVAVVANVLLLNIEHALLPLCTLNTQKCFSLSKSRLRCSVEVDCGSRPSVHGLLPPSLMDQLLNWTDWSMSHL